ncbi:MAG: hypothetical protein A3F11_11275 [Gammaproteobacteria bacterium RIFCSPHIGHO2_12_FULL_37_14]|nr:MAG: hypothetical protein A3F11_11275 [Gammaproteobacteria bacterium RIFCSPHIGHO2_12_FULL_37_14]
MNKLLLAVMLGVSIGLAIIGLFAFIYSFTINSLFSPTLEFSISLTASFIFLICVLILLQQLFNKKKKLLNLGSTVHDAKIKLYEQQHLFETIFNTSGIGIALLNLDGRFLRVNASLTELLGYGEADMLTMNYYYLIHPNDLNNQQMNIQQLIDKQIKMYYSEQQCFRKNGEIVWVTSTMSLIRDENDKPLYFIVQVHNITQQKQAEDRLHHMAYHDPLTGLANRNKLEQFINHVLATSRRHKYGFALLFLDLDRFKNINDTIGHEAGDLILQIIAERLRSTVRSTDMVARLGGDEFVLVVTDVKKTEGVALIAKTILENVLQVIIVQSKEIYLTTSIGISMYPYDGHNIQTLMKNADLALYRSKEHGRNNYQFYTSGMTNKAQEKMALQNALGHALVKNEFTLAYQPKMEIKTRRITGIEALLRWKNQEYNTITPDEIILLAEETGLIVPVSNWVMKTACQQLKVWHNSGLSSLTIAINCSGRQFKQTTFVDDILDLISQVSLPPPSLEIEITESIIMQEPENTLRVLYALKDLGIQIVIDDFGTGYWSLNNLRRLSVDKIKIDKSFIKQIIVDETSATITRAIIAMVNKLGIVTIAEGVETREQYDFLAQEGCTEIQGYYLTQPLSDVAMGNFLQHPVPDAEVISKTEVVS